MNMSQVQERSQSGWHSGLAPVEAETLLRVARDTLAWSAHGAKGAFSFSGYVLTAALRRQAASFVTLFAPTDELRGCMGNMEAVEPLFQSVHHNADHAARHDPRFFPVDAAEWDRLRVHVSILSEPQPVPAPEDFIPGRHGVILEHGSHRAVFLPEVAAEQGWNREQTLQALCRKAGIGTDRWRQGSRFWIFHTAILSGIPREN